ncbi:DUF6541 family protein [Arthrobacter sp. UYEF3]|uniref:DUF6541 family protein n=1 Tax=Arthrobacter sp. UYEF3 TaxID=1756365 RepID=UPI0033935A49
MWWSVLPQIIGAAVLLISPGMLVALAVRFRGFDAFALAPALTVGVVVATSTLTPVIHVRFGLVPVTVVSVLVAAAGFFAARFGQVRSGSSAPGGSRWRLRNGLVPFAAFGIAAALLAASTIRVIGTPQSFSQTYDAVFHLNSVKYALDTGQASSLTIGGMTGGGFYPAGWNAVASLVASTTGADVPTAVSITSIILASVFWPLGCLLLVRWIVGSGVAATIGAGVACASLGAFPILMMDFGVLYPNLLAISILPGCIALTASHAGLAPGQQRRDVGTILVLLLGLGGLVVAHPTTFMAWLAWTLPMAAARVWTTFPTIWRNRGNGRYAVARYLAVWSASGLAFVVLWAFLRPPEDASFWGPYGTVPQSLGEALTFSPVDLPPAWLVAPLALLGLWVCCRRPARYAWVSTVFVIFTILFVFVAGFSISPIRDFLTGIWYNDSYRIAALLPLVAVLLTAIALDWASDALAAAKGVRRPALTTIIEGPAGWRNPVRATYRVGGGIVLLVCAIALGQQGGLKKEIQQAASRYTLDEDSALVSRDELSLIQRLRQNVPPDAVLIDNPYTGAALSYALGDRKSAQLHILSSVSPGVEKIYESAGSVSTDPSVCEAVRAEHGYYILDFGPKEVHGGHHEAAGLTHLDQNPGVQLVDSQGDAKLYKITACGG